MNEKTIDSIARQLRLAFMTTVTVALIALTLQQTRRGIPALPTTFVYALAAGFGLEFVGTAWAGRWRGSRTQLDAS